MGHSVLSTGRLLNVLVTGAVTGSAGVAALWWQWMSNRHDCVHVGCSCRRQQFAALCLFLLAELSASFNCHYCRQLPAASSSWLHIGWVNRRLESMVVVDPDWARLR